MILKVAENTAVEFSLQEIKTLLGQNGVIGPDRIPFRRLGAMFIRGAFHDAGEFGLGHMHGPHVIGTEAHTR